LQPLSILFGAGFTCAVGYSFGAVLFRNTCTDPAIRFVTGSAILSALVFAACALGVVFPLTFLALGTLAIAAARSEWRISTPKSLKFGRIWLLFVPFLLIYAANAMAPEISFDGSRYHLGLVAHFFREHGFHPVRENLYAAFPEGVEMLYLFAFAFGRHSAAALTHLAFLLALAWQVFTWGRREGREVAGLCAAFLVFASPLMGVDASSAYIDVAVAAVAFTLFYVLHLWSESGSPRLLAAAGILAGFAFASKYTAFLAVPYAVGYVAWRSKRLAPAVAVAGIAAAVMTPWLLKNYVWFQSPLAPFFNQYFPNPYITASFEKGYRASQAAAVWREVPLQLTVFGSLGGLFGPIFLLAPIAIFRRDLLLPAAVFGAGFLANPGARFLIPSLAFVALAMCLTAVRATWICFTIMAIHALISWPTVIRHYCRADAWRLDKVTYREALRIKPEEGYLESNLPDYGITRLLDRVTPPGAVIFTQVPIPEAYTSREIRVGYQSAANIASRRVWFTGFVPEHAPVWRTTFRFAPRNAAGFRIVQTGSGATEWTVHEVHAYEGDRELPRGNWRVTASPFPWGANAVIDGRITSFWMCGDYLRPGQFLQVAMPAQRIDRIAIDTALDEPDARYRVDLTDEPPQFEQLPTPPDLRRQAAAELRRRGIDYLLAFDTEFGADDLRTRSAAWGIRQVAEYKGARLYQLP